MSHQKQQINEEDLQASAREAAQMELKRLESISQVGKTLGGKELLLQLEDVCRNCIEQLAHCYTEHTHTQFIAISASLRANLELYRTISGASSEAEIIKKLIPPEKTE